MREQPPAVREAFGVLAATVGEHAGVVWPFATEQRRFTVTGRSAAPQLDKTSMVWLRLRAMFGLGARAEILRFFLSRDDGRSSVATISAATNYTKRNHVARQLVTLEASTATGPTRILAVKVRGAVDEMEEDLDDLGIDSPSSDVRGEDLRPAIRSVGQETLGAWSLGRLYLPDGPGDTRRCAGREIS